MGSPGILGPKCNGHSISAALSTEYRSRESLRARHQTVDKLNITDDSSIESATSNQSVLDLGLAGLLAASCNVIPNSIARLGCSDGKTKRNPADTRR